MEKIYYSELKLENVSSSDLYVVVPMDISNEQRIVYDFKNGKPSFYTRNDYDEIVAQTVLFDEFAVEFPKNDVKLFHEIPTDLNADFTKKFYHLVGHEKNFTEINQFDFQTYMFGFYNKMAKFLPDDEVLDKIYRAEHYEMIHSTEIPTIRALTRLLNTENENEQNRLCKKRHIAIKNKTMENNTAKTV
jgi:hypothetical protein